MSNRRPRRGRSRPLPKLLRPLFWDYRFDELNWETDRDLIVGRVLARTARRPQARRTRQVVSFGLATVLMIVATPWPGMANGRPLFRV